MLDLQDKSNRKKYLLIGIVALGLSAFFYYMWGKALMFGWLLGLLFTFILQMYRKFMYPHLFRNFKSKGRVMVDLYSHQLTVILIVLVPFILSIKHRETIDLLGVFLAFFCERIYWFVSQYLKGKRRV